MLNINRTKKVETHHSNGKYGDRAFSVSGPKLWNGLPLHIRVEMDTTKVQENSKTFLSKSTFVQVLVNLACRLVVAVDKH